MSAAAQTHARCATPDTQRRPRKRALQIDLNKVPSSMEQLAESWRGNR